jgi:hypothetical protein
MTDDQTTVAVPVWALTFILENADLADLGPPGQGWKSDDMKRAVTAVEDALKDAAE